MGAHTRERTAQGMSTCVYRVETPTAVHYLRVAPSPDESLMPEAEAHRRLFAEGARVPAPRLFEEHAPELERSALLTAEIPGAPLASRNRDVLLAAGRELAKFHRIPVTSFGWLKRDRPEFVGPQPTLQALVNVRLEEGLPDLLEDAAASARLLCESAPNDAVLCHGDFDTTQIFEHKGVFSGIIDFSELLGAEPAYDLGHFLLYDGERLEAQGYDSLREGYAQCASLPAAERVRAWAVVIGVHRLGRRLVRGGRASLKHETARWLAARTRLLLG